jgi:hypothetical protein
MHGTYNIKEEATVYLYVSNKIILFPNFSPAGRITGINDVCA